MTDDNSTLTTLRDSIRREIRWVLTGSDGMHLDELYDQVVARIGMKIPRPVVFEAVVLNPTAYRRVGSRRYALREGSDMR